MSLKARLLFTVISLVVVAILVMAGVALRLGVNESELALTKTAAEKLNIENRQTRESILRYVNTIESQIRIMSSEKLVEEAASEFKSAFNRYSQQRSPLTAVQLGVLEQYYTDDFASLYKNRNNTNLSDAKGLVSPLTGNAKALQYDFIAGSSFPIGEKDSLYNLGGNASYAIAHGKYHDYFRKFLKEFGYYDIFIADIDSGNIVYSVYKELDYATSVLTGPYAATGIGDAFRKAASASDGESVHFSTLDTYLPSYDAMAGFSASPIKNDVGESIAILIYQMPLDVINEIMTHSQDWQNAGLGESGETYIVSPASKLVTESRFFLEHPESYVTAVAKSLPQVAAKVKEAETTVGIQPVNTPVVNKAIAGNKGFQRVLDYRGIEVFSAYSPVKIGDTNYALLAEIDVEEALLPATALRNKLITGTIIALLMIALIAAIFAVWLANRLVKPLLTVGDACSELASGEGDLTVQLASSAIPEINRIIEPFNAFIGQIRSIIAKVKDDAVTLATAASQLSSITSKTEQHTVSQNEQMHLVGDAINQLSDSIANVAKSTVITRDHGVEANSSLSENQERADVVAENIQLLVKLIQDSSQVIGSLKDEVGQITTLLNVITSIADQTNLLALNAAIEAARAGEAGRGFSVVADEVRALANRSQESTVEIAKLVDKMNLSSEQSVIAMEKAEAAASGGIHLVDLVTLAMTELSETINQVQDMATMVAQATEEQDSTSNSVLSSVATVNDLSEEVRSDVAQANTSAKALTSIATNARSMVDRFKV